MKRFSLYLVICFASKPIFIYYILLYLYIIYLFNTYLFLYIGVPGGSVGKNLPANAGGQGAIPGLGRSPGGGNGDPLQDSCLENPMDRGAWCATVQGVTRAGCDLMTKPPPAAFYEVYIYICIFHLHADWSSVSVQQLLPVAAELGS